MPLISVNPAKENSVWLVPGTELLFILSSIHKCNPEAEYSTEYSPCILLTVSFPKILSSSVYKMQGVGGLKYWDYMWMYCFFLPEMKVSIYLNRLKSETCLICLGAFLSSPQKSCLSPNVELEHGQSRGNLKAFILKNVNDSLAMKDSWVKLLSLFPIGVL